MRQGIIFNKNAAMSLIIENLKIVDRKISIDVGDEENSGEEGKLIITCIIDGHEINHEKIVTLAYPPKVVTFENTRVDGKNTIVSVTLSNHNGSTTRKQILKFY